MPATAGRDTPSRSTLRFRFESDSKVRKVAPRQGESDLHVALGNLDLLIFDGAVRFGANL
jgi:hypothetical protein